MNQLEVRIMGQGYVLRCPDGGEARLTEAAQRVDAAMCSIRDAGKIRARDRIAVLAALNLAFELGEPAAAEAPAAAPAPAANDAAAADDATLAALLQRLDRALGEDGQLL
ncbi:cell division protein ZapA [Ottowia pentelensis]|uniref:Cell division protein ZapA n=1 Tax=Ottowia pentelensis TaxID=511108 RepID=A0ABV6PYE6_9BURK|nr:cell division protein ZapA [Pseudomonadota bacterium]MBS0412740.1 cell division protein ZapA [Pseudomonadota bacterium]HMN57720.1 cell division protein ZapA [Ottowia sp.]